MITKRCRCTSEYKNYGENFMPFQRYDRHTKENDGCASSGALDSCESLVAIEHAGASLSIDDCD